MRYNYRFTFVNTDEGWRESKTLTILCLLESLLETDKEYILKYTHFGNNLLSLGTSIQPLDMTIQPPAKKEFVIEKKHVTRIKIFSNPDSQSITDVIMYISEKLMEILKNTPDLLQ